MVFGNDGLVDFLYVPRTFESIGVSTGGVGDGLYGTRGRWLVLNIGFGPPVGRIDGLKRDTPGLRVGRNVRPLSVLLFDGSLIRTLPLIE